VTKRVTLTRGGRYHRVVDPSYSNPFDTSYARTMGRRWNPRGEFGALYLCATIAVAAANARYQFVGRAIKLFDLLPAARPELVAVDVANLDVVDVVTANGVAAAGLPPNYPYGVPWPPCQAIAHDAFADGIAGVAARSNAEATASFWVGEELAVFDSMTGFAQVSRDAFAAWYPDPIPGSAAP
jgi:RES domain-containing protein